MNKKGHRKIIDKIEELPDDVRKLALLALELSYDTNASSAAESLFHEINNIEISS